MLQTEVQRERLAIDASRPPPWGMQQRIVARCECDAAATGMHEVRERLDPGVIAREQQCGMLGVVPGEREHAVQACERVVSPLVEGGEQHLRVRLRAEVAAQRFSSARSSR